MKKTSNSSNNSRPIIMMRKKPTIKREPVYDEPMSKVARLTVTSKQPSQQPLTPSQQPIARPLGAMSPDSGCGDYASDGNVSSPGSSGGHHVGISQSTSTSSLPPTPPPSSQQQNDMSTMIEQAFARSVGEIPSTPPPTPTPVACKVELVKDEAPVSPLSSDLGAVDMDLFDQLDLTSEMLNQQAPPWEELDIDIEPSFSSITPFLNL